MTLRNATSFIIKNICFSCLVWEGIIALLSIANAQQHAITPTAPPPPIPIEIQCLEGESLTLILKSSTRSIQQLKFLIRKHPHLGSLSDVQVIDRTSAVVEYHHDPLKGVGVDEISYAVQAPNSSVSVASKIQITVNKPPPILEAASIMDFGESPIGQKMRKSLELKNSGGSPLSLTLRTELPWSFEGPRSFVINPGESAVTVIAFQPSEVRQFSYKIDYEGAPDHASLRVLGSGIAPFTFNKSKLALEIDPHSEVRSGVAALTNQTGTPIQIQLSADEALNYPKSILLGARETLEIPISVKQNQAAGVETTLQAQSNSFVASIQVKAYPGPPKLISKTGDFIDFGKVVRGRLYRQHIQLTNVGGVSARMSVALPEGVHILPNPESIALAPGKTETFEVLYEPRSDDIQPLPIHFSSGARTLTITLIAEKDVDGIQKPVVQSHPAPTPKPDSVIPSAPEVYLSGIPKIEKIGMKFGKQSVTLIWDLPASDAFKFILEERLIRFKPKEGITYVEWRRIPAKFQRFGNSIEATLENIQPGTLMNLRIFSEDTLGYLSEPSPMFRIEVPLPPTFRFPWWMVAVLFVILAIIFYKRRQKAYLRRLEDDTERISRIN